ncbi:MAG: rhomboid family intramembrane serine protease, partial [bacterium]
MPDPKSRLDGSLFFDPRTFVTTTLIVINFSVWAGMLLAGGSEDSQVLISFGAEVKGLIWLGQYWRLITAMFLHIGFMHFAFNNYALLILGRMVEPFLGRIKYLILYLSCGVGGSLLSLSTSGASVLSAGASGAVFGLAGAAVARGWLEEGDMRGVFEHPLGKQLILVIALNLMLGMSVPGINNSAHVGGLSVGFLMGYAFFSWGVAYRKITRRRRLCVAALASFVAATTALGVFPVWRKDYYLERGRMALEMGLMDKALVNLQKAHERLPSAGAVSEDLARVLLEQGKFDEVIALLEPMTREAKPPKWALVDLGQAYSAKGDAQRAETSFVRALRSIPEPEDYLICKSLGELYLGRGQFRLAEDYFGKARKRNPFDEELYLLGVEALRRGRPDSPERAFALLEEGRKVAKEQLGLWVAEAELAKEYRQFNRALRAFGEARRENYGRPLNHPDEALCLAEVGRTSESLRLLREIARNLEATKVNRAARVDRLVALYFTWQEELRIAGQEDEEDMKKVQASAESLLREELETSPTAVMLNALAWQLALEGDHLEEAEKFAEQSVALNREGYNLDTLGWIYHLQGKNSDGGELLREAQQKAVEKG